MSRTGVGRLGRRRSAGSEAGRSTPRRRRSRWPARRRWAAQRLYWVVFALQAAVLLSLAVTTDWPAVSWSLFELLWAAAHRPLFYPLTALILAGPPLTAIAWQLSPRQRVALVLSWLAFLGVAGIVFGDKLAMMCEILWWAARN